MRWSHCIISGSSWCQFVPLLMLLNLHPWQYPPDFSILNICSPLEFSGSLRLGVTDSTPKPYCFHLSALPVIKHCWMSIWIPSLDLKTLQDSCYYKMKKWSKASGSQMSHRVSSRGSSQLWAYAIKVYVLGLCHSIELSVMMECYICSLYDSH